MLSRGMFGAAVVGTLALWAAFPANAGVPETVLVREGAPPIGRPWEFDATDVVVFGKPNVVAVKVNNRHLDELGTGGITGPAMLWAEKR